MLLKDLLFLAQATDSAELSEFVAPSKTDVDTKVCVVYGGRFQPFHKGHWMVYRWLCKKFDADNVWIATSNKTNFDSSKGDVSPFNFKEKQELMVTLYGIKPRRVVQSNNPAFAPKEVWGLYKGYKLVYVAAVGEKDLERYKSSNFFSKFPGDLKPTSGLGELNTLDTKKGYYVTVPSMSDGTSGTTVREAILAVKDDEKAVEKVFRKYFGEYDHVIADMVVAKLKDVK